MKCSLKAATFEPCLKKHQEDIKESKKALGTVYHPYDLETGAPQSADVVSDKMEAHYAKIQVIADDADLSDNSMSRLEKAHRVFKGMIHTMAFFWSFVAQHIASVGLTPEMESIMRDILIPAVNQRPKLTPFQRAKVTPLSRLI